MRVGQWIASGIVVLHLALMAGACSKSAGLTERVMAYQKAYDEHNVEEVVGMFTGNAFYEIVGSMRLQGKKELRDLVEYNVALNVHLDVTNPQATGDTVFCKVAEINDWLTVAGIDTARFDARFVFEAGKIDRIIARPSAATAKAVRDILMPLTRWASEYRPDLLQDVMPDGTFAYNAVTAEKALALLIEWQDATSADSLP